MDAASLSQSLSEPSHEKLRLVRGVSVPLPVITFVVLGAALVSLVFLSERYQVGGGLGEDGSIYVSWIRGWKSDIPKMGLHSYSAQRVLPALVMRRVMLGLHWPFDPPHFIRAYQWLNATALLVALACWNRTSKELTLTRAGYLVGTFGMFGSFSVLKWIPFDPVLTDATAFSLANVALMLFFTRSTLLLAIVAAMGSFVWPSFGVMGCTLLFFPRQVVPRDDASLTPPASFVAKDRIIGDVLAALVAGTLTLLASQLLQYPAPNGVHAVSKSLFRVSCGAFALIVFFGLRHLVRPWFAWTELKRMTGDVLVSRSLAILVLAGVWRVLAWISSAPTSALPQPPPLTASAFLILTLFLGVQRPAVFLIAHAVFLGPFIVAAAFFWKDVCRTAQRYGLAIPLLLAMGLLMGLNSESRRLITFVPVLVPVVCITLGRFRWTLERLAYWGLITLFASRIWHTILTMPVLDDETFFAMVGPWMPNDYAVIHGIISLLIGVWIYRTSKSPVDDESSIVWLSQRSTRS